ncbi:MAG: MBL fold metallo-hydrolase [Halanaeroarchaeum sp.]
MIRPSALLPDGGHEVTPDDLYRRIRRGESVHLLDVRTPEEFAEWHIDGDSVTATNVPGPAFEDGVPDSITRAPAADEPFVVVCAKGISSATIAARLRDAGIEAANLADGMEGWARVYDRLPVERYEGPGTLFQYRRPSSGCLSYLLVDDDEAAIVDPLRAFTDRYRTDATDLEATLRYAFDTHVHADHFSGVRQLATDGVEGVVPGAAIDRGVTFDDEVTVAEDGDTFSVGDATVDVIHTPGHTTGMTSYLVNDSVLLTGDGLFIESVARPDLEAGDEGAERAARQLYESLHERILSLDDDVVVAPSHFSESADPAADGTYTSTLAELRATMPILEADEATFVDRILSDMPPRPANYRTIVAANLGREAVSDADAFQLELGPNNCATNTDALTSD